MDNGSGPLVLFLPSGRRGRFTEGTNLLAAARTLGVDIDSVCGGRALCGRCQVDVAEGSFARENIESRPDHASAPGAGELRLGERGRLRPGRRLACQACIQGDLVIDVPATSQVHRQVVRKRAEVRDIKLDPVLRLHFIEVAEPDMHHARGDFERVAEALRDQWGIADPAIDLGALQALQRNLRAGKWRLTVAIHDGRRIVATRPGFHDRAFGIAVDIGSTTIAGHLCDLASGEVLASDGMMNPQIRFGEDLMSRVSYVMMNPGGEVQLTAAVRGAIAAMAKSLATEAGVDPGDVFELVFVGNPIMQHLLLGIDPTELGGAPFALAADSAMELRASELGIDTVNADARAYVLPCIAGHVGADTAGVILSEGPHLQGEMMLVVDVGTNAEIVLGNRDRLLACSSPTGPAFEGAQLSCGQRAAPGAIERVRIDPATLEPRYRIIGCDAWSDDPAFAERAGDLQVSGICGSGIIEAVAEMFLAGIIDADGVVQGAMAARSPRIEAEGRTFSYRLGDGPSPVRITQADIRAIQLAKAALHAGTRLLMDGLGLEKVDRVMLAGAFGSHIDPLHAMILGMIPDCPLDRVQSAGNAAGTGARIALLDRGARREIERVVRRIEKVETAVEPRFQEHFVAAMAIPHKTAATPNLAAAVTLPTPAPAAPRGRRRSRGAGATPG